MVLFNELNMCWIKETKVSLFAPFRLLIKQEEPILARFSLQVHLCLLVPQTSGFDVRLTRLSPMQRPR